MNTAVRTAHLEIGRSVVDVVGGEDFIRYAGISRIEQVLDGPTDDSLVLFQHAARIAPLARI